MTIGITIMLMVSFQIQKMRSKQQFWKQRAPYFNKTTQRKLKIISSLATALSPCCMSQGESFTMVISKYSKKLAFSLFRRHVCIFLFFFKDIALTFYFMVFFSNKDQDLESIYASKRGLCDQLYWFSRSANRIKNIRGKIEKVD